MKGVMLLALQAKTDDTAAQALVEAVGEQGMRALVEFWDMEFEV